MMRLVLLEGLPGTGKSTTAAWVAQLLADRGERTLLLAEGDPRGPLAFYQVAGMPIAVFEQLPVEASSLCKTVAQTPRYIYVDIGSCPDAIADDLRRYDIGDETNRHLTLAEYMACALNALEDWVCKQEGVQETLVIDSGFLQNPLNEIISRGAEDQVAKSYIASIAKLLAPLHPVCIYLRRKTAQEAIAFAKRAKGDAWAAMVDTALQRQGCADLFERRFSLEQSLLPLVKHIVCDVEGADWSGARRSIEKLLC